MRLSQSSEGIPDAAELVSSLDHDARFMSIVYLVLTSGKTNYMMLALGKLRL